MVGNLAMESGRQMELRIRPFEFRILKVLRAHFSSSAFEPKTFFVLVSGGLDSMTLLHCFARVFGALGGALASKNVFQAAPVLKVLHFHHNTRGRENDLEEALVADTCLKLGCSVEVEKWAHPPRADFHELARKWRNECVQKRVHREQLEGRDAVICTAHHSNDVVETMLLNLVRGCGVDGLLALPEWNPKSRKLRPFVGVTRCEILEYAKETGVEWLEDSSNSKLDYQRNKLRHLVLPVLHEINPSYAEAFVRCQKNLAQVSLQEKPRVSQLGHSHVSLKV
jgi:tRNA(Ile)-lysidine synthase